MFKNIIFKKKNFLLNFNQFPAFRDEKNIFINSIKFFARKEINKNVYLANMNSLISEKNESLISKNKLELKQDLIKNHDISTILKNFSSSVVSNKVFKLEHVDFKEFYIEILNSLLKENIDIKGLDTWLKLIEMKYSSEYQINNLGFKLLVLIDQILNNNSIENYKNKFDNTFINSGFDHLISLFGENFYQINSNNEDLLLNNFLYFMLINKGELSDLFKILSEKSPKFKKNLERILSQSFKYREEVSESKINYTHFMDYESNNKHAPSEITNDYSFKYRDINNKTTLYNNLVCQKQNIYKIKYLINSSNQLKNDLFGDLIEIEKIVSTFLLREVKDIISDDIIKIQNEINKFNKIIEELSPSLSELKILLYNKLTMNNLENIFNPLFSGEKNMEKQFKRVANIFGNESAKKLFDLFSAQQRKLNTYTFKDLFNMNLIIKINYLPIENSYFNIFIQNNYKEYDSKGYINLYIKPFALSNQEKVIFDEIKSSLNSILKFSSKINDNVERPLKNNKFKENVKKPDEDPILEVKNSETLEKIEINKKEKSNKLSISNAKETEIINISKNDFDEKTGKDKHKNISSNDKLTANKQNENKYEPIKAEKNKYTENKVFSLKSQVIDLYKFQQIISENKDINKESQSAFKFEKINDMSDKIVETQENRSKTDVNPEKSREGNETKNFDTKKHIQESTVKPITSELPQNQTQNLEPKILEEEKNFDKKKFIQETNIKPIASELPQNQTQNVEPKILEEEKNFDTKKQNQFGENEKIENTEADNLKQNISTDDKESSHINKEKFETNVNKSPEQNNTDQIAKSNSSEIGPNKKNEDFLSMEEKFKKQKMKKIYFNENKNYHSITKRVFKNFSTNVSQIDDNEKEDIESTYIKISSKKEKKRSNSDDNILLTDKYNNQKDYNKNFEPKKNQTISKFTKLDSTMKTNPKINLKIEKKVIYKEDDLNILKFLEKEDENLIEKIDLSNNNEIIVEANQEMNDFSINYWINFYQKNRKEKNIEKVFEEHLIQKLRYF